MAETKLVLARCPVFHPRSEIHVRESPLPRYSRHPEKIGDHHENCTEHATPEALSSISYRHARVDAFDLLVCDDAQMKG